jgi:hypothetical protein
MTKNKGKNSLIRQLYFKFENKLTLKLVLEYLIDLNLNTVSVLEDDLHT